MAFIGLWAIGLLLCILAIIALYKGVVSLKDSIVFQKQFKKTHSDATLGSFDQGWIWLFVILTFLILSLATQAGNMSESDEFAPDVLVFIGIAIYCASKAVDHWKRSRMVFYKQGFVFLTDEIPYSTIRTIEPAGSQVEIKTKKRLLLVSKKQAAAIQERMAQWKRDKRNRNV